MSIPIEWHPEVLPPEAMQLLDQLQSASLLEPFYLAGGTALALQLGHRRSVDLDFFSSESFDVQALIGSLHQIGGFSVTAMGVSTLHGHQQEVKISFLNYDYPVLNPFQRFRHVRVAGPFDIACMKLSAIAARGARRDFIDLHAVCLQSSLGELIDLFQKKYAGVNFSRPHLLKSLTWFEDAEKEPMPDMLAPTQWDQVKDYFLRAAPRHL